MTIQTKQTIPVAECASQPPQALGVWTLGLGEVSLEGDQVRLPHIGLTSWGSISREPDKLKYGSRGVASEAQGTGALPFWGCPGQGRLWRWGV